MFLNSQGPMVGVAFSPLDICRTLIPSPSPVPVILPIPYPNLAMRPVAIPTVSNVFTMMMPNHNLATIHPISTGDEPGLLGGLVSSVVMGPCRNYTSSTKVIQGASPVTRMLDVTAHNGMVPNAVGTSLSPSQIIVMVLS